MVADELEQCRIAILGGRGLGLKKIHGPFEIKKRPVAAGFGSQTIQKTPERSAGRFAQQRFEPLKACVSWTRLGHYCLGPPAPRIRLERSELSAAGDFAS